MNKTQRLLMILLMAVLALSHFSPVLGGSIFSWKDKNGTRHWSNVAPPASGSSGSVIESRESRAVLEKLTKKQNREQRFKVKKVYDGDTLLVTGLGLTFKVRMAGIDAPETAYRDRPGQPYGHRAKKHLQTLVSGRHVRLKSLGIGAYNRQLAEVFLGRVNINQEMLRAGLAEVYQGRRPAGLDSETYFKIQRQARKAGAGMWAQGSRYQSPRQWRRDHPRK